MSMGENSALMNAAWADVSAAPNVGAPSVSFRFGIRGVFCFLVAYKRFNFPPVVHEPCVYSGQCSMKRCAHFRKRG